MEMEATLSPQATMTPPATIPQMGPMPRSSRLVLEILSTQGEMSHKDLMQRTRYSSHTVRNALRLLKERKLIIFKLHPRDLRQLIYLYRMPVDMSVPVEQ